jgi:hypothetical protein
MPRGGARPGAGRKASNPKTIAKKAAGKGFTLPNGEKSPDAPPGWPFGTTPPAAEADPDKDDGLTDAQRAGLSPLDYLLAVMRSGEASKSARLTAAIQAAPYMHAKPAPAAKKGEAAEASKKAASGKFKAASVPLKLVGRK